MERIDEIIKMFDSAQCPKNYEECPLYQHNDCDNYCPFVEASDMLKDYKRLLVPVKPYMDFDGRDVWRCGNCGAAIFHISSDASDEDAKNYAKFCRHCGRPVKW